MSSSRDRKRAHRLWLRAMRTLRPFVVLISTLTILLHAALGVRRTVASCATIPAAETSWRIGKPPVQRPRAEPLQTLAFQSPELDDVEDDSDESDSERRTIDSEGLDEMTVQQFAEILRPTWYGWLWYETRSPRGVIHSPEPRPARSV